MFNALIVIKIVCSTFKILNKDGEAGLEVAEIWIVQDINKFYLLTMMENFWENLHQLFQIMNL